MQPFQRVIVLVLDSAGIGELPDAARYGDQGSSTIPHTADAVGGLRLPTLQRLGLGNIVPIRGVPAVLSPLAAYGKMVEVSPGKDTTTGHWELMGVILNRPFPTYPHGFPQEIIATFEAEIGRKVLGNKPASGTEIIKELGEEHLHTGSPIVYTSADSVFQIAAHEEIIPVGELYEMCRIARRLLSGGHAVSRVIARPFVGKAPNFVRTDRRRDFSLEPPAQTVLDVAQESGLEVVGIGKIEDIFAGRGLTRGIHTHDDMDGLEKMLAAMEGVPQGLIFANVVDLDTKYGHRNDPQGYSRQLEQIDRRLQEVVEAVQEDDLFILTADHGNDPTTPSTDHSREYVPVLAFGPRVKPVLLGVRKTFADVGATVGEALGLKWDGPGRSFLGQIMENG